MSQSRQTTPAGKNESKPQPRQSHDAKPARSESAATARPDPDHSIALGRMSTSTLIAVRMALESMNDALREAASSGTDRDTFNAILAEMQLIIFNAFRDQTRQADARPHQTVTHSTAPSTAQPTAFFQAPQRTYPIACINIQGPAGALHRNELLAAYRQYGQVMDVITKQSGTKHFAHVQFSTREEAAWALNQTNGTDIRGLRAVVKWSKLNMPMYNPIDAPQSDRDQAPPRHHF